MPNPRRRPARRTIRTWSTDSTAWDHYRPRPGDIVVSTYPKCGTTWTQRIVSLLIFQMPQPRPIMEVSPWLDRRASPLAETLARLDAQAHRRFLKAHLPLDALPYHPEVRYIHVARDGRDACMSYHNHWSGLSSQALAGLDRIGLADERLGRPYPRPSADPAEQFHEWLTKGVLPDEEDGWPTMSFFRFERSWWEARAEANLLLVHYSDLKGDLAGEMRRIADFLDVEVDPDLWPALVAAAGFDAMRRDGDALMGSVAASFDGGGSRFFHKGTNGRWRGIFREEDLARYAAKIESILPADCGRWLASGRLVAGDP